MNDLISIIVPVYNAEKFLNNIIDCISKQTYENFEVVFIDDGSTDNSKRIIKDYINKSNDKRFNYYYKKNGGVSSARNEGINKAKGKYLLFIDSDDTIDYNLLFKLYQKMITDKSQLAVSNGKTIYNNKSVVEDLNENDNVVAYIASIFNNNYSKSKYSFSYGFSRSVCSKLYKSEIIKNNKITFDENMYLFEDAFFNLNYINFIDKISYVDEVLYYYYIDNGSSRKYRDNLIKENNYKINKLIEYKNSNQMEIDIPFNLYLFDLMCKFINNTTQSKLNYYNKRKVVKNLINNKMCKDIIKSVDFKYLSFKKKFVYIIFRLHMYDILLGGLK